MLNSTVNAQESEPEIWLPISHSDQLRSDLDSIIAHASTRQDCDRLLEAKLSDSSHEENPKFIITCETEEQETLNFVYWGSDVANNFSEVTYKEASEEPLEDEAAFPKLTAEERQALVQRCKLALSESLYGKQLDSQQNNRVSVNGTIIENATLEIADEQIFVRQRDENSIAVFMDYQQGSSQFPIDYTATCLSSAGRELSLHIYAR